MKVSGYCTECRKVKVVTVTTTAMVGAQALRRNVFEGVRAACEEAADGRRRDAFRRRGQR